MVIYMAVDCKSHSRQGRLKFVWISQEWKSEIAMAHENKT